jgi:hypothetical protein
MRLITKIKDLVMGILDKQNDKQRKVKEQQIRSNLTNLNQNELKYLLQLISKSDFKGADLQTIFSITAKLQNQLKKSE